MVTESEKASLVALDRRFTALTPFVKKLENASQPEIWQKNVLGAVILRTRGNYYHLQRGYTGALEHLCWATRNLLELRIWTEYVTLSKENARRFLNDQMIDGEDFIRALKGLLKHETGQQDAVNTLCALECRIKEFRMEYSFEDETKFLNVGKVAKLLGCESIFYNLNIILSKLVHPTALSVLGLPKDSERDGRDMMLRLGIVFSRESLDLMVTHLKTFDIDTSSVECRLIGGFHLRVSTLTGDQSSHKARRDELPSRDDTRPAGRGDRVGLSGRSGTGAR